MVTNYDTNNLSLLLGNGDGTFQPQKNYATRNSPTAVVAADPTAIQAGPGGGELRQRQRDRAPQQRRAFAAAKSYTVGKYPTAVVVGD